MSKSDRNQPRQLHWLTECGIADMNRHLDEVEETAASAEQCWAEMTRYLLVCLAEGTEVGDEVAGATFRRMRAYRASHPELRWSQAVSLAAHEAGGVRFPRLLLRLALVAIKMSRGVA